jgi:hypothetical protein
LNSSQNRERQRLEWRQDQPGTSRLVAPITSLVAPVTSLKEEPRATFAAIVPVSTAPITRRSLGCFSVDHCSAKSPAFSAREGGLQ